MVERAKENVSQKYPSGPSEPQIGTGKQQTATEKQQTVAEKVIHAVADAEGVSPLDLRPLVAVIDPDALNRLFPDATENAAVEFTYHGHRVRVSGDEQVTVG